MSDLGIRLSKKGGKSRKDNRFFRRKKQLFSENNLKKDKKKEKQTGRPDSVTAPRRYDSHSSRPMVAHGLKLPTRTLRGPRQCVPTWNCTGWRLPRFTVTQYARLCGPVPRLIPCGFRRTAVSRHPVLWCPDLPPAFRRSGKPAAVWSAS